MSRPDPSLSGRRLYRLLDAVLVGLGLVMAGIVAGMMCLPL